MMNPFDQAWAFLKNDPDGEEGEYQCTSCEMMFDTPHEDDQGKVCPHCYGPYVKGSIDDPWSDEELQEIEEQKASEAQMKRSLADSIRLFGISGSTLDLPDYSEDFEGENQ